MKIGQLQLKFSQRMNDKSIVFLGYLENMRAKLLSRILQLTVLCKMSEWRKAENSNKSQNQKGKTYVFFGKFVNTREKK